MIDFFVKKDPFFNEKDKLICCYQNSLCFEKKKGVHFRII